MTDEKNKHDFSTIDRLLVKLLQGMPQNSMSASCASLNKLLAFKKLDAATDVTQNALAAYMPLLTGTQSVAANPNADTTDVANGLKALAAALAAVAKLEGSNPVPAPMAQFNTQVNNFMAEVALPVAGRPAAYINDATNMQLSVGKFNAAIDASSDFKSFKLLDKKLDIALKALKALFDGKTANLGADQMTPLDTAVKNAISDVLAKANVVYADLSPFDPMAALSTTALLKAIITAPVAYVADQTPWSSAPSANYWTDATSLQTAWTASDAQVETKMDGIDNKELLGKCSSDIVDIN